MILCDLLLYLILHVLITAAFNGKTVAWHIADTINIYLMMNKVSFRPSPLLTVLLHLQWDQPQHLLLCSTYLCPSIPCCVRPSPPVGLASTLQAASRVLCNILPNSPMFFPNCQCPCLLHPWRGTGSFRALIQPQHCTHFLAHTRCLNKDAKMV